jgi:aryl-phospho-beta-D-glucosidase BglC (GH1 family)
MFISGILGNMSQESGFNPDSIGPGGFYGTVQMSNDMVKEVRRAYGKVDHKTTNKFIYDAMSGNKIISAPWRSYMKQNGGYFGRTFNTASDAAMAFGRVFERPNENLANWS